MKIFNDYDLSKLNTFGIKALAKFFVEINSEEELKKLFINPIFVENQKFFLGGGSNTLFTKNFNGIVVLNKLQGIAPTKVGVPIGVGKDEVLVRSMSGEIWHDLVIFSIERGYWGIENLSLVPGTVGAAPIQNIGAYGAELKDTLFNVEAFEIKTGKKKIFSKKECELGYRDSVFKNKLKDKYFISSITLKLSKIPKPNLSYKILSDYLEKPARRGGNKIEIRNSKDISNAVASIRRSKLPNPKIIGNAGSFFKNVFIDEKKLKDLLQKYPNMPYFEEETSPQPSPERRGGEIKIPAGWLIEQCGPHQGGTSWKGYKVGNVGVHEKQALVLVNYGGATGDEIVELANKIMTSIKEKFDLDLIPEVNIV